MLYVNLYVAEFTNALNNWTVKEEVKGQIYQNCNAEGYKL